MRRRITKEAHQEEAYRCRGSSERCRQAVVVAPEGQRDGLEAVPLHVANRIPSVHGRPPPRQTGMPRRRGGGIPTRDSPPRMGISRRGGG